MKKVLTATVLCAVMLFAAACRPSDPSGDGNSIPEGATATLGRAVELAENMDHFPTASDTLNLSKGEEGGTADKTDKRGKTSISRTSATRLAEEHAPDYVDFTDPANNEKYQAWLEDPGIDQDDALILESDMAIVQLKEIVAFTRENVVMLDTWVEMTTALKYYYGQIAHVRLSYDRNADVATIEGAGRTSYLTASVTELADGRDKITAKSVWYGEKEEVKGIPFVLSCNYEEGKKWSIHRLAEGYSDSYSYICECDLTTPSKEFCFYARRGILLRRAAPDLVDLTIEPSVMDDVIDREKGSFRLELFDEDHHSVGYIQFSVYDKPDLSFQIDPFALDGWDQFAFEDSTYYLARDGKRFLETPTKFSPGSLQSDPAQRDTYEVQISYGHKEDFFPPRVRFFNIELSDDSNYGDLCIELLAKEGLSVRSQEVLRQIKLANDLVGLRAQFDSFEFNDPTFTEANHISEYITERVTPFPTLEEVKAAITDPVYEGTQTPSTDYFYSFEPTAATAVTLSEGTGSSVDLSAVTLTLKRNVLTSDGEYSLVVAAIGEFGCTVLGTVSAPFQGDTLTLTGLSPLALTTLSELSEGSYRLCVYLALGEDKVRASDFFDLTAPAATIISEGEKTVSLVSDGTSLLVSVALPESDQ